MHSIEFQDASQSVNVEDVLDEFKVSNLSLLYRSSLSLNVRCLYVDL